MSRRRHGGLLLAALLATAGAAWADDDKVKVEGTVAETTGACPDLTFRVAGMTVRTSADTEFDDGACGDVTPGRRVEVKGRYDAGGTLIAREVELED